MKKTIITIILLSFLFAISLFSLDKAPDFQLEDMKGKRVKLSKIQEDGLVIVDFWASWCKPCCEALPELNKIHEKYENVTVLAICCDAPKTQNKAKTFVKSNKFKFKTLFDSKGTVKKKFNVGNIPHSFIIAPDGTIIEEHTGYKKGDEKHIEEVVEKWLKDNDKK